MGFLFGRLKDSLDAREARRAFLRAVHFELLALKQQLNASREEVKQSLGKFRSNQGLPPRIVGTIRTAVFSTQLAKLKDVADPLLMDIIKLYSDLGVLEQIMEKLDDQSAQCLSGGSVIQGSLTPAIHSTALVLDEQLSGFLDRINALIPRLPPVESEKSSAC